MGNKGKNASNKTMARSSIEQAIHLRALGGSRKGVRQGTIQMECDQWGGFFLKRIPSPGGEGKKKRGGGGGGEKKRGLVSVNGPFLELAGGDCILSDISPSLEKKNAEQKGTRN